MLNYHRCFEFMIKQFQVYFRQLFLGNFSVKFSLQIYLHIEK